MQCTKDDLSTDVQKWTTTAHPVRNAARRGHRQATALLLIVKQIDDRSWARSCYLTFHPTTTVDTIDKWRWRADCLSEILPATDSRATRRRYASSRSLIAAGRPSLIRHRPRRAEPQRPGTRRKGTSQVMSRGGSGSISKGHRTTRTNTDPDLCAAPLRRGPAGHAWTSRSHQKEPGSGRPRVLSGGIGSSATRASRGSQRGGPCLSVASLNHYSRGPVAEISICGSQHPFMAAVA